jgi:hypothetical protein
MVSKRSHLVDLHWRKAQRSIADGECVEVAQAEDCIAVRDSKDPNGAVLRYKAAKWKSFVKTTKKADWYLSS